MRRTHLGKKEASAAEKHYNNKGQLVDPNTRKPLIKGQIHKGHKYGYEDRAMRRCAERCKMSQADFDKMNREFAYKIFHLEDAKSNMSHMYECKDPRVQNHYCMKIIREYKNKDNGKSKLPAKERNAKSSPAARNAKSNRIAGYKVISYPGSLKQSSGEKSGSKSSGYGKSTGASHGGSFSGGKSAGSGKSAGGGKGVSAGSGTAGGKGVSAGSGSGGGKGK